MHRYLQFFFNSALVVLFLYLLLQFILTVQRDVEHRVSEYSMGTSIIFLEKGAKNLRITG
jgi:Di-sulfide bridge nucleocytoplasmic transport domain